MKIGLTTSVIQRGRSGVGQYVLALVRALLDRSADHEFTLFVLKEDLPLFAFVGDRMRLVTVPESARPAIRNLAWHQWVLPRLARELRLDVLHVPSYRRLLWRQPCALVATIHDLAPFRLPHKYDFWRMLYGRVAVKRLARRQHEIVAVSQETANDIRRFFDVPETRLSVIRNGLDHQRFNPEVLPLPPDRLPTRDGQIPPFFLYVARLEHPAKNHARLISAFERFKAETNSAWQLVLCGSDWHGAEVIHQLVRDSRYAADIRVMGFIPDADVARWYRSATVCVYPSLFEGFGLPPLEAMACGCPVLASAIGAVAEVCGDAAYVVNPTDVYALAQGLRELAHDRALRDQLRQAGIVRAREFNWTHTAAEMLKVYARAARPAPAACATRSLTAATS